jgi:hypothetical protein
MGVAYSGGHVEYSTLRADTIAHLQADLDALLLRCGWTHTAVTGGYAYLLTSPQDLQAKLTITNSGDTEAFTPWPNLRLVIANADGSAAGQWHFLATTSSTYATVGYEAIAGPCQLFVALRGYATQAIGRDAGGVETQSQRYAFACGVPYVSTPVDACATSSGSDTTTATWWASSKETMPDDKDNFRSGRYCSGFYDVSHNGTTTSIGNSPYKSAYDSPLELFPLTETQDVDFWFYSRPQVLKYGSGDPLFLNPFVGWGFKIYGQLWDAFLASAPAAAVDDVKTTTETDTAGGSRLCTWLGWNYKIPEESKGGGGTWYATLYLLTTKYTRGVENLAY